VGPNAGTDRIGPHAAHRSHWLHLNGRLEAVIRHVIGLVIRPAFAFVATSIIWIITTAIILKMQRANRKEAGQ
jgi:hypothetical protein